MIVACPRLLLHPICVIALSLPFFTGCNVDDPTIKAMIKDMGAANATATRKKGDTHEGRNAAVSRAVQKYFPPGMKVEDAFKLLKRLKEDGFDIRETRYEGARAWPDGEFRPYLGEVGRLTHQQRYPKGVSEFGAQKQVGAHLLIVENHAAISFRVVDGSGVISEVKGTVWASGI